MKAQEIQEIITNYNALEQHTEKVIEKLGKLDSNMYGTARGIEEINFYETEVSVQCDNSWRGCPDTHYFDFPISFLSMSDEELEKAVIAERERREEEERLKKERIREESRLKHEQQEKLQYERLKKKFENQ